MRQLIRGERGVSTIEFALIAPILILLTVACLDVARALNAAIVLGGASEEGAHYAILHPSAAPSAIASAAQTRVAPLTAGSITVTAEYYNAASSTFVPWPSAGSHAAGAVGCTCRTGRDCTAEPSARPRRGGSRAPMRPRSRAKPSAMRRTGTWSTRPPAWPPGRCS